MSKGTKKIKKKKVKCLGKKRRYKSYKTHSLTYNKLGNLLKAKKIKLNINSINEYTKINENIMKGNFIGALPNNDFLTENYDENNYFTYKYTIYSNKSFKPKLIFFEEKGGKFFLIGKNYGGYFTIKYIKIYIFYKNNT